MPEQPEHYEPTAEEVKTAEGQLTESQRKYSEARQEWFGLPQEINISVLPERMDFGFHEKRRTLSAFFDGFTVELKADVFPGFDGNYKMDDFNYEDAEVSVDNKILGPPRSAAVAKKMLRLYGAWQKMKSTAFDAAYRVGPEAMAKDIFNVE